jgi:hypothetical protein
MHIAEAARKALADRDFKQMLIEAGLIRTSIQS